MAIKLVCTFCIYLQICDTKIYTKPLKCTSFQESVLPAFEAISQVSEMEERFYEELKVCSCLCKHTCSEWAALF